MIRIYKIRCWKNIQCQTIHLACTKYDLLDPFLNFCICLDRLWSSKRCKPSHKLVRKNAKCPPINKLGSPNLITFAMVPLAKYQKYNKAYIADFNLSGGCFGTEIIPKCTKWSNIKIHGLFFGPILAKFQCAFFNSKKRGKMTIWSKKQKNIVFV